MESLSYLEELFGLTGKSAIVTGASRGLGASMAVALARAGAKLVLVGRQANLDATHERVRAVGGEAVQVVCDQTTPAGVEEVVATCLSSWGSVDVLVNNAGTFVRKPALEWTAAEWDEVVELSMGTVFALCLRAGREMLAQGSGKIINIASVLAFQGGYTVPAYAASRHGLVGLTQALANEWASRGVNVNAIAPGYMDTDLLADLKADPVRERELLVRVPAGRWGRADEIDGACLFLASPASDFMHGTTVVVDGGWLSR